jgi:hypothetical protein
VFEYTKLSPGFDRWLGTLSRISWICHSRSGSGLTSGIVGSGMPLSIESRSSTVAPLVSNRMLAGKWSETQRT